MDGKFPKASATHHEHMIRPQHTNARSTAFGGEVMAWVDTVAAVCAMRHCGKAVVTASIDSLHFLAPIPLGWIACLDASVNYAGRTSCEVGVKVTAYNPITAEQHHTASAYLTFVALDSNGRPAPIPKIVPETPKDKERYAGAEVRRKGRLELKQKLSSKTDF
jgi:acyl-CoA hydrolase